jgi:gas vesicle protein
MTMQQENVREETVGTGVALLTGLVGGAVVGASLGILFAPRRGSDMRKHIADSATSVGEAVTKTVDVWSEQGRAAYDRVRDVASRAGDLIDRMGSDADKPAAAATDSAAGHKTSPASMTTPHPAAAHH